MIEAIANLVFAGLVVAVFYVQEGLAAGWWSK
jgi:hypothetical protein